MLEGFLAFMMNSCKSSVVPGLIHGVGKVDISWVLVLKDVSAGVDPFFFGFSGEQEGGVGELGLSVKLLEHNKLFKLFAPVKRGFERSIFKDSDLDTGSVIVGISSQDFVLA